MPTITKVPSEHDEQAAFCKYLNAKKIVYAAVPNGMYMNLKGLAAAKHMNKLKAEGFKSGFPDLMVMMSGGRIIFIEMKRAKGSSTSAAQKKWNETLIELGFEAHICNGCKEAIGVIENVKQNNHKK